jgi:hypothetical protein
VKLLVATNRTQGLRANDFSFCVEGELVNPFLPTCGSDLADPDGGCGCGRSFAGLNSQRATTTAEIREVDFTEADVLEAVRASLEQSGWGSEHAPEVAQELISVADHFPVGTVVERRLDELQERDA